MSDSDRMDFIMGRGQWADFDDRMRERKANQLTNAIQDLVDAGWHKHEASNGVVTLTQPFEVSR